MPEIGTEFLVCRTFAMLASLSGRFGFAEILSTVQVVPNDQCRRGPRWRLCRACQRPLRGPLIAPVHLRAAEGRFSELSRRPLRVSGKASLSECDTPGGAQARPLAASAGQASLMPGQAEFGRVSRRRPTVARKPEPTGRAAENPRRA